MHGMWNQKYKAKFSKTFFSVFYKTDKFILRYFLLGDASLLGPQSEITGVHQLCLAVCHEYIN